MRLHDTLAVERQEIVVLAETQRAQQRLAAGYGLRLRQTRLLSGSVVKLHCLASEADDLLKRGFAILEQIVLERRKSKQRHGNDGESRKRHHDKKSGRYPEIG